MPVPELIFKPVVPGEAVATLVLIENSQAMAQSWSDLRDHHLPTLLGTMRLANPIVPIQVLWLITSPVDGDDSSPSHYNELPDVRFDTSTDNKISPAIINRGVTLLASTFKGQLASRHLLLVAASSPSDAHNGSSRGGVSEWQRIAQRFHEERIFFHAVLNPAQNMSTLNGLYYDALNRQHHQEVVPWFAANPMKYLFRLAGTPPASPSRFEGVNDVAVPTADLQITNLAEHPPLLRNSTYPPDAIVGSSQTTGSTSESQPDVVMPSLVTRLQKMHGLTKKKIYGTQPPRQPFVSDEPVRDKYRQVPTPLSIPLLPPSSSSITKPPKASSRAPSKTKFDRAKRLSSKGPLTTAPPEAGGSSGRRSPWYRRNSRAALPTDSGSGSYPSSPTSVSSFSANSPVLPTPRDFDNRAPGTVNSVSTPWEPSWLRDQTEQYSATTLSADATSTPAYEQEGITHPYAGYPSQHISATSSSALTNNLITNNFTSTSASVSLQTLRANEHIEVPPGPIDDGDRPFILCPEYEAAAAARFNAIFQSSPQSLNYPEITSVNGYEPRVINSRDSYYTPSAQSPGVSSPPPVTVMEFPYGQDPPRQTPSQQFTQIIPHSSQMDQGSPEFYPSAGSSSLEGWDGR